MSGRRLVLCSRCRTRTENPRVLARLLGMGDRSTPALRDLLTGPPGAGCPAASSTPQDDGAPAPYPQRPLNGGGVARRLPHHLPRPLVRLTCG